MQRLFHCGAYTISVLISKTGKEYRTMKEGGSAQVGKILGSIEV